jgi:hypothetical protein
VSWAQYFGKPATWGCATIIADGGYESSQDNLRAGTSSELRIMCYNNKTSVVIAASWMSF